MMRKPLAIIGAPSSAGAFAPGQEKAPAVLRNAGLIEMLTERGLNVADHGDTARFRWRPDREHPTEQNVEAVLRTALDVEQKVRRAVSEGCWPLVIGGDCTVGMGTVAGHLPTTDAIALLYFDLHPDLNVPDVGERQPGALDWMGVAHMLGEIGTVDRLSRFAARYPLLADHEILFLAMALGRRRPGSTKSSRGERSNVFLSMKSPMIRRLLQIGLSACWRPKLNVS